jgi:polyprenyldihydroxybenzoate methyltransferase/3-demethylubiquinol 3-O-methyltransferase
MQCLRPGGVRVFRSQYLKAYSSSTINAEEIEFFTKLSSQWWDERGEFALLHRMNPARVGFIRDKVKETMLEEATSAGEDLVPPSRRRKVLFGMNALDIGCGGGLLSEVSH